MALVQIRSNFLFPCKLKSMCPWRSASCMLAKNNLGRYGRHSALGMATFRQDTKFACDMRTKVGQLGALDRSQKNSNVHRRANGRTGALGEMEWRQLWRPSYAPRSGFHKGPSTVTAR